MRLKRQLISKWFLLLIAYIVDKLFREIVLEIQSLVHYGHLIHQKFRAWYRIFKDILWWRLNDVYKGDSICYLDLDSEYAVGRRIWHLPQHDSLYTFLDTQFTRPSPKVSSIVIRQFYHLRLGLVLPYKRHSLIRFQRHRINRLHLAYFDEWLSSIREHILRSNFDYPSEFIDMFILDGG